MDNMSKENPAESLENWESFADQIQDFAIYMLDAAGYVKSWHVGAQRLFGYTAEEIVGSHISVGYTSEDVAAGLPQQMLNMAAQQGSCRQDGSRVRKDGTTFCAAVTITALRDKSGKLQGFAKLTHDISKYKAIEVAYLALFDDSHEAVLFTRSSDGAILRVNKAACDLFGYAEPDLLGKQRDELVDRAEATSGEVWTERDDEASRESEPILVRKGGGRFEARVSSKLFVDETGQQVCCTTIQDIAMQKRAEEALRASEEKYRTLFDNMTEGFVLGEPILDASGNPVDIRYLVVNEAFYVQIGVSGRSIVGLRMREFFPHVEQAWIDRFAAVALTGQPTHFELFNVDTQRHYDVRAFRPSPNRFANLFRDITEQKRAQEALRQSEEKFRATFEHAPLGIAEVSLDGRVVEANPKLAAMLGYTNEELKQLRIEELTHPSEIEQSLANRRKLFDGENDFFVMEKRYVRKDRSLVWVNVTASLTSIDNVPQYMVVAVEDITARKRVEEDLKQAMEVSYHQANHDMLTGLANRARFHERLKEALDYASRDQHHVAVHLLDLDRFKAINDTHGHHVGDLLLREVAERIKSHVRVTDLAARLGGDEFVVIQTHLVEPEAAGIMAEKLLGELGRPYVLENHEIESGASIGIAVFPNDADDPEKLIKHADLALYEAKNRGRSNHQFYRHELGAAFVEVQRREQEMVRALHEGEFCLDYQPQFDLSDGAMTGIEALLRWRHPTKGKLAASEFLMDAEHARLMVPIGEWAFQAACRQHKAWIDDGLSVPMTLNLSAMQLRDPRLLENLKRILAETGLPASMLQLEMRESVLWDPKVSHELLAQLKERGLRLGLENFGAEMTALPSLDQFPVDTLKPGLNLVKSLPSHPREAAILTAIVRVAHNLNIIVCADGVETDDQFAAVKERGCDSAQGYLLSSPLDARQMQERIDIELRH
jgi:diguanylate cyclase (GGDEF)-like protein/PAS domain S-box-containing protein